MILAPARASYRGAHNLELLTERLAHHCDHLRAPALVQASLSLSSSLCPRVNVEQPHSKHTQAVGNVKRLGVAPRLPL